MTTNTTLTDQHFDVVICGGGMAGLTLARQLRQTQPGLSVAVVEPIPRPLPLASHKVGESSVELGSIYLRRLGLRDYLRDEHIIKLALRFFPGGGRLPLEQRDELGPGRQPLMVSYQMDRGKLETDLRAMIIDDGATLFEGAKVVDLTLSDDDAPHRIEVSRGATRCTLTAGWVVDATGRRALIRRKTQGTVPLDHVANAGWFRVSGKLDISEMVSPNDTAFHSRPTASERWRSTNHFMGDGYWVWVIPLVDGRTSLGIVAHEPQHGFERVRTLDACMAFLDEFEPQLAGFLRAHLDGEAVLDFRCLKRYSHDVARWLSPDRWSVVGEAGAFLDPLYSPGADSIALSNALTCEVIAAWADGRDFAARVDELQTQVEETVRFGFSFFRGTGALYGHARVMAAKYSWDNFLYWNFLCQYFTQSIYRLTGDALAAFDPIRDGFHALNEKAQRLFAAWVELDQHAPEGRFVTIPDFPSLLVESNLSLLNEMDAEETEEYMTLRLSQARQMLAEMVLRVLAELGPKRGAVLVERIGLQGWGLSINARRLDAEALEPAARRKRLGKVARDMDAHLYPLRPHPEAAAAVRLAKGG